MQLSTKQKTILIAIVTAVLVIGIVAVVLAATVYAPSNTVTVTVNPTPSPSPSPTPPPVETSLTPLSSTIIIGNQVTLTATLVDHAYSGITINFYEGTSVTSGTFLGASVTNVGVATYTFTPSTIAVHTYIAQPQGTLP